MLVRFTKQSPESPSDTLTCARLDGSTTTGAMPRQGILPHDALHFVVESSLGWRDAFFGQIERGESIQELTRRLHQLSGTGARLTQALQSEALVECLGAEQWGGAADPSEFVTRLLTTCRRRGVPPPDVTAGELDGVRSALREFGSAWRPLAPSQSLERTF